MNQFQKQAQVMMGIRCSKADKKTCSDSSLRTFEVWDHGVKQDTTHSAHRHRLRVTLTSNAFLWIGVHAAITTLVMSLELDTTILAPILSPTVLNEPILAAILLAIA